MTTTIKSKSLMVHKAQTRIPNPVEAVSELKHQLACPNMAVVVVFCSIDYDREILAKELQKNFQCPVIGCTTAGEIGPQGYSEHSITGFSLESESLIAIPNFISDLKNFDHEVIKRTAESIQEQIKSASELIPDGKPFGFFLIDGMSGCEEQWIGHLYHSLETVPVFGGSAGGGNDFDTTYIYYDGSFHTNAALFTTFYTSLPFEIFRTQHFVPTEGKMVITKAIPDQRLVLEINGKPAAMEYARLVGLDVNHLDSYVFANHPVMLKVGGEYYVRSAMRMNEDGSITFACAIDEGLVVTLADGVDIIEDLEHTMEELNKRIKPQVIIGCECLFRKLEVLQKDLQTSISRIMAKNNIIGFHTYGEQINSVHVNQTLTGIAIGGEHVD